MRAARLLVADEHALFRAALAASINGDGQLTVVGEASDADGAVARTRSVDPDLVLVSTGLGGRGGLAACADIKELHDQPRVVVVSETTDQHVLIAAVEAGADGYVTKDMPLADMVTALQKVSQGETHVPPGMLGALLRQLIDRNRAASRAAERFSRLTRREKEVLELLADGCQHDEVAEILVISPQTARTHIQNVISKLGVHSRLEAAAFALDHDLVERPSARRT